MGIGREDNNERAAYLEIFFRSLETEIADDEAVVAFCLPPHLAEVGNASWCTRILPICTDASCGALIPGRMEGAQGELLAVDGTLIQLLLHLLRRGRCVEDQDGDACRAVNDLWR
jgi:hypothetical protein